MVNKVSFLKSLEPSHSETLWCFNFVFAETTLFHFFHTFKTLSIFVLVNYLYVLLLSSEKVNDWKQIKHRKFAFTNKTLFMQTLN